MVFNQPMKWAKWLPLAEYWYNTNFHSALKQTPFEALYGYSPPQLPLGSIPKGSNQAVHELLTERHKAMANMRDQLLKA
jgi:hypothetical protein